MLYNEVGCLPGLARDMRAHLDESHDIVAEIKGFSASKPGLIMRLEALEKLLSEQKELEAAAKCKETWSADDGGGPGWVVYREGEVYTLKVFGDNRSGCWSLSEYERGRLQRDMSWLCGVRADTTIRLELKGLVMLFKRRGREIEAAFQVGGQELFLDVPVQRVMGLVKFLGHGEESVEEKGMPNVVAV